MKRQEDDPDKETGSATENVRPASSTHHDHSWVGVTDGDGVSSADELLGSRSSRRGGADGDAAARLRGRTERRVGGGGSGGAEDRTERARGCREGGIPAAPSRAGRKANTEINQTKAKPRGEKGETARS